jgi:hypothetical protein
MFHEQTTLYLKKSYNYHYHTTTHGALQECLFLSCIGHTLFFPFMFGLTLHTSFIANSFFMKHCLSSIECHIQNLTSSTT